MVFTLSIDNIDTSGTLSLYEDTYIVDASSGGFTITLPEVTADGMHYKLIRTDNTANTVTVEGDAPAETIDGQTTLDLLPDNSTELASFGIDDGTGGVWYTNKTQVTLTSIECSPPFSPADEVDLVVAGNGPDLTIRKLNGGHAIDLDIDNDCVNISVAQGGGNNLYDFPTIGGSNKPYVDISGTTASEQADFIYRGSDVDDVTIAKVVAETDNREAIIEVYDVTNVAVIFTITVPASTPRSINVMTLTGTVPAGESIFSIRTRLASAGNNAKLYAFLMQ